LFISMLFFISSKIIFAVKQLIAVYLDEIEQQGLKDLVSTGQVRYVNTVVHKNMLKIYVIR
ncbi:MAG: hypothetical protein RLZZ574_2944, partial [Cyanobacteriota bacterium]